MTHDHGFPDERPGFPALTTERPKQPWTFWTLCVLSGLAAGMGMSLSDATALLFVAAYGAGLAAYVWLEA